MGRTIKPDVLERVRPLIEGLTGQALVQASGLKERDARWYAQQVRAEATAQAEAAPNGQGEAPAPPAARIEDVPLEAINLLSQFSGGRGVTQAREKGLDHETVDKYAEARAAGAHFPPVVLFREGNLYWIGDGYHRIAMARKVGATTIQAEVRRGTQRDALLYACGANTRHGLPRTNADKRRAVDTLLRDPKWSTWSNGKIARHCEVTPQFVGDRRRALETVSSDDGRRTYINKYGQEATMDTARIGQHTPAPAEEPVEDLSGAELVPSSRVEAPALILTAEAVPANGKRPTFNQTNEMVDWAKWTWNPVTGCLHDCEYCYARDLAERFYPEKFEPTFHPERLKAPHFTKVPGKADDMSLPEIERIGWRNVFVCSMADLFGKWVPDEWIKAVLTEVRAAPQWNFLFLTKFPQRLAGIDWPKNAWVGTTVDKQYRVSIAEKAFRDVNAPVKWLSCEPLLEDLTFTSLEMFDWVVFGGQSKSTKTPAFQPPWPWVEHLQMQARAAGCLIYFKPNLLTRPQEYPELGAMPRQAEEAPDA